MKLAILFIVLINCYRLLARTVDYQTTRDLYQLERKMAKEVRNADTAHTLILRKSERREVTYFDPEYNNKIVNGTVITYYPNTMKYVIHSYVKDINGERHTYEIEEAVPPIALPIDLKNTTLISTAG